MPGWIEQGVEAFFAARREAGLGDAPDDRSLVTGWLEERLVGREAFAGESSGTTVEEWSGRPTLLLLAEDRIAALSLDGGDLTTTYHPAPVGGSYVETWRLVDNAFELELRYEHPDLPGPISQRCRTLRVIERRPTEALRTLLASWATGS